MLAACAGGGGSDDAARSTDPSSPAASAGEQPTGSSTLTTEPGESTDTVEEQGERVAGLRVVEVEPGPAPAIPAAPTPFPAADDPIAAAAELAAATTTEDAPAAWLTVYERAGVPVVGRSEPSADDDPVGPEWWFVWAVSAVPAGTGIRLTEWMLPWTEGDQEAARSMASALLDDLGRLQDGDEVAAFTVAFLQAKAQQAGTDLLAGEDPDQVVLDAPTGHLLTWLVARMAVQAAVDDAVATGEIQSFRRVVQPPSSLVRQAAGTPCSEILGGATATSIANFVIGKAFGGISIGTGEAFKTMSVANVLKEYFPRAEPLVERFSRIVSRVNVAAALSAFVTRLAQLQVFGASADNLERTRRSGAPGAQVTVRFDLAFNAPTSDPDSPNPTAFDPTNPAACLGLMLVNFAGITVDVPIGPAKGVQVVAQGGKGFPSRVLFGNYERQGRQDADESGSVFIDVVGAPQPRDLPDDVPPRTWDYGIRLEASLAPLDGDSVFNTAVDSMVAWSTRQPSDFALAVLDILKVVHYSLGEQIMPMTDWGGAYAIDSLWGDFAIRGTICAPDRSFVLEAQAPYGQLVMTFSPTTATTGTIDFGGEVEEATITGTGTYELVLSDGGGTLKINTEGRGDYDGFVVPSFVDVTSFPLTTTNACE